MHAMSTFSNNEMLCAKQKKTRKCLCEQTIDGYYSSRGNSEIPIICTLHRKSAPFALVLACMHCTAGFQSKLYNIAVTIDFYCFEFMSKKSLN